MEEIARELPGDFSYAWAGQALQEKESGSTSSSAFIFGLILVFLLLAAQFEKWTLPIAVVLTVPIAVLGALLLTWALGLENDVYFQVGLVTLVGLSAKNAILICEFAIEHVHEGMSRARSGHRGGGLAVARDRDDVARVRLRLRAAGDRDRCRRQQPARHRHGVIGGMLASMLVAVIFAPLFFFLLESLVSGRHGGGRPANAAP